MQPATPGTSAAPRHPVVTPDGQEYRYAAFISYRHVEPDRRWAKWLHEMLETYRVPSQLRRERGLPARVGRIFRDEEELAASDNLGREIEEALVQSKFLIVVCSPRIVSSRWCNKEVERFRELGRHDRILALLIEGDPSDSFLPALREIRRSVTEAGGMTREQVEEVEPLAADVRPASGQRQGHAASMARLRLLAHVLGVRFDDLRQRDRQRRRRRRAMGLAAMIVAVAGLIGAFRLEQRAQVARRASTLAGQFDGELEKRDWQAERVADMDRILTAWEPIAPGDAAAGRLRLARGIADDVDDRIHRPYLTAAEVEAIKHELGLLDARDPGRAKGLQDSLAVRLQQPQVDMLLSPAPDSNGHGLWPAWFTPMPGEGVVVFHPPDGWSDYRSMLRSRHALSASLRAELTLDQSWEQQIGIIAIAFGPASASPDGDTIDTGNTSFPAYTFHVHVTPLGFTEGVCGHMADARARGGSVDISIMRGPFTLRSRSVPAADVPTGPLRLSVSRERDRLTFQLDDLPPMQVSESLPLGREESGFIGLRVSAYQRLREFRILQRALPPQPNPLELADAKLVQGDITGALVAYQESARVTKQLAVSQEARFKETVCLIKLDRKDEAADILATLTAESGDRWPGTAGAELWAMKWQAGRFEEAADLLVTLVSRFKVAELAAIIPDDARKALVGASQAAAHQIGLIKTPSAEDVARLEELTRAEGAFDLPDDDRLYSLTSLAQALEARGDLDSAFRILDGVVERPEYQQSWALGPAIADYDCLMCVRHQPEAAIQRLARIAGKRSNENWVRIERARLNAVMGRLPEAEADLRAVLAGDGGKPSRFDGVTASVVMGFLRERQGDPAGARIAWRDGFRIATRADGDGNGTMEASVAAIMRQNGRTGLASVLLAGGLSDAPNEQLQPVIDMMLKNYGLANGMVPIRAQVVRAFLQDPRGHEWARHLAMGTEMKPKLFATGIPLIAEQLMRDGALSAPPNAEQAAVFAVASSRATDAMLAGRLGKPECLQLYLVWRGTSGLFLWGGIAKSMPPALRGPVAYVMGLRFKRLGKSSAAREMFKQAQSDATDDEVLRRLAEAELAPPATVPADTQPHVPATNPR